MNDDKVQDIQEEIRQELKRAMSIHPPMLSLHHGKAVIEEEFDELWDEIKLKNPDKEKLRAEAIQVAAMAVRFIHDLC